MRSRAFSVQPGAGHPLGLPPHVLKGSFRASPLTGSSGQYLVKPNVGYTDPNRVPATLRWLSAVAPRVDATAARLPLSSVTL